MLRSPRGSVRYGAYFMSMSQTVEGFRASLMGHPGEIPAPWKAESIVNSPSKFGATTLREKEPRKSNQKTDC